MLLEQRHLKFLRKIDSYNSTDLIFKKTSLINFFRFRRHIFFIKKSSYEYAFLKKNLNLIILKKC